MCGISVDTFDQWVRDGFLPGPALNRGQIRRWHWPTVERWLLTRSEAAADGEPDPYMTGVAGR